MQIFDNKKLVFFTMNERSAKISLLIIEERRSIKISACEKKKRRSQQRPIPCTIHFSNSSRSSMPPRQVLPFYEVSVRFQSLQLAIEVHAGPKL